MLVCVVNSIRVNTCRIGRVDVSVVAEQACHNVTVTFHDCIRECCVFLVEKMSAHIGSSDEYETRDETELNGTYISTFDMDAGTIQEQNIEYVLVSTNPRKAHSISNVLLR